MIVLFVDFSQLKPGGGVFGIYFDGFFEILLSVVGLALLCGLQTFFESFTGVLRGESRRRAGGESFDVGHAMKNDGSDVGVVEVSMIRERQGLGPEARKHGAELAPDQLALT